MTLPHLSTFFSNLWKVFTGSEQQITESEVLDRIYQQIHEFVRNVANLFIIVRNKRTGELEIILAIEDGKQLTFDSHEAQQALFEQIGREKITEIMRTGDPILLNTQQKVKDAFPETDSYLIPSTWMGVPMRLTERVIGAFVMYHPDLEEAYNENELKIFDLISDQAAIVLDNVRQVQRFKVLSKIQQLLTNTIQINEKEILELVFTQTQEILDTRDFSIILHDTLRGTLRFALAIREGAQVNVEDEECQTQLSEESALETIRTILQTREPVLLQTQREVAKAFRGIKKPAEIPSSWLGVPMRLEDKVIGAFVLRHPKQEYAYDRNDADALDTISDQTAIAISNARLTHRREVLSQIKHQIVSLSNLDELRILEIIYSQAKEIVDTYNLSIILYEQSTDTLRYALACRNGERIDVTDVQAQKELLQKTPVETIYDILSSGDPVLLSSKQEIRMVFSAKKGKETFPATWLGVPMRVRNKVIGVFSIYHTSTKSAYNQDDIDILDELSDQTAIALDNVRLNRQFKILAQAEQKLTTIRSSDETAVLSAIYEQTQQLIDARNLAIILYDKLTDALKIVLACEDGERLDTKEETLSQHVFTKLGRKKIVKILQSKTALLLKTRQEVQEQAESDEEKKPACWLGVPMRLGQKAIGAFVTYHPTLEHAYDENDLEILDAFTDQAANAIDNARLTQRFKLISEVEQRITSSRLSEDQILRFISEQTQKLQEIDTRNLAILLYDRKTEQLSCFLAFHNGSLVDNIQTEDAQQQLLIRLGEKKIRDIIHQQAPLLLETREKVTTYTAFPDGESYASWLGVPMRLRETAIGVFVTYHESREYAYDADDLQILSAISDQAAIALDNVRLTHRLETLSAVEREIASDTFSDEEEVLHLIHSKAQRFKEIDTRNLAILLQDEESEQLRVVMAFRQGKPLNVERERVQERLLTFLGQEKIEEIIRTGSPLVLKNEKEVEAHASSDQETYKSWLGVPMRLKDGAIGAFVTYHARENAFDDDDVDILDALSDQAASAITSTRRFKVEHEQRQQAEVLQEVVRIVNSTLNPQDVGEAILEQLQKLLEYDSASIQYIQGDKRTLLAYHGAELYKDSSDELWREISKDALISKVVTQGHAEVLSDTGQAELWQQLPQTAHVKSWIGVPIIAQKQVIGLLTIDHKTPGFYTHTSGKLAETFANQIATALSNSEKAQALEELHDIAHNLLAIGETTDPRELLQDVANRAKDVLLADLIDFYEYREERDECVLPPVSSGKKLFPDIVKDKIHKDDTIVKLLHGREPQYIQHSQTNSTFAAPYEIQRPDQPSQRYIFRENIHSTAVIPLRAGTEIMGLMFVNYRASQSFAKDQRRLIELFANQAAIAIKNARLYHDVYQRRKALIQIAKKLTAEVRLRETEVFESIYQQAAQLLDMKNLTIALYDDTTDTVRFVLGTVNGRRVDVTQEPGWGPRQKGHGKTETIIRSKAPLLLNSQAEVKQRGFSPVPGHKDYEGTLPNSWLGVPMIAQGKVLGVIANYDYGRDNLYTQDDVDILLALADQTAIALENARLSERFKALTTIGQDLTSRINIGEDDVLEMVYEEAVQKLHMKNFSIALYEPPNTVHFALASRGGKRLTDLASEPRWQPRQNGKGKTEKIIKDKEPLVLNSHEEVLDTEKDRVALHKDWGKHVSDAWLGVPMMIGEKVLGVLADYRYGEGVKYTGEEVEIFQSLANLAAIALENARLYKELAKKQTLLQSVIDNIPDEIYAKDSDSRFILANRAVFRRFGFTIEKDLLGKTDFDLFPEKNAQVYHDKEQEIMRTGEAMVNAEGVGLDQKGKERVSLTTKTPFYDENRNLLGLVGISRDITRRKQAEDSLKASEQRLMDIINFLPYATFAIDNEGKVTFWNQAIEEMTGAKADDIKGKGGYEYSLLFFKERRPILIDLLKTPDKEFEKEYKTLKRRENSVEGEIYVKNGELYLYSKAAKLYDPKGNVVGAIETIVDITARRNAEKAQKALIDLAQKLTSQVQLTESQILQSIYENAYDFTRTWMDANNMYIALYDESTDMIRFGLVYVDGERKAPYQPRKLKGGQGKTEDIIRTGAPLFHRSKEEAQAWYQEPGHTNYVPDLEELPICWVGVPMKTARGKVLGVIATYPTTYVYTDADFEIFQAIANLAAIALENTRLVNNLKQEQDKIADRERELVMSGLAMDFAHKINNLAGPIPPWVSLIKRKLSSESKQNPKIVEYLDNIVQDVSLILREAHELRKPMNIPTDVEAEELIGSIVGQVEMMTTSDIDIIFNPEADLPLVNCVESQLASAIYSVIQNATKAISGQGQIFIDLKSGENKTLEIIISDTGCGIPADKYAAIFEYGISYWSDRKGSGYGLWRARNIIQSMRGTIEIIKSAIGKGTTFKIILPTVDSGIPPDRN